jgi:hypothetical protein
MVLKPVLRDAHKWVPGFMWLLPAVIVTFEDFFARPVHDRLGPLLAFGNPEDYLQPLGAVREYVPDDAWQVSFLEAAERAHTILVTPASSGALGWELRLIVERGLVTKTFVIVGPLTFARRSASPLLTWFHGWQRGDWCAFRAHMAIAGYQLPVEEPPAPSVIGFDHGAQAIVCPILPSVGMAHSGVTESLVCLPGSYIDAIETLLGREALPGARRRAPRPSRAIPAT